MAGNKYRKHFLALIMTLACMMLLAAVPNVYYDPLCCFLYFPSSDRPVPVIDSRLQKTNHLLHGPQNYSAVLLGSSRVEQFRQQDFLQMKEFNYAAPSYYPDEASRYLALFLKKNSTKPKVVFLGLDFYGSNLRKFEHAKSPQHYIETCSAPFYALKASLSKDTLAYSLKIAKGKREMFMYDQLTLDKLTLSQGAAESQKLVKRQLEVYQKTFYGDYFYNCSYSDVLKRLRNDYSDLDFVVFTTPVSKELFKLLVKTGRLSDYEQWIKDIVGVFGKAYNFMIMDKLTLYQDNFMDAHHLYPEKTASLARIISGRPLSEDQGIGVLVTRQNIHSHLVDVRKMATRVMEEAR